MDLTTNKREGYVSTLLVLALTTLLLGTLVATYSSSAIKHRSTMGSVSRQATQPIIEKEGAILAKGVVEQVARSMQIQFTTSEESMPKPILYPEADQVAKDAEVNKEHREKAMKKASLETMRMSNAIPKYTVLPLYSTRNGEVENVNDVKNIDSTSIDNYSTTTENQFNTVARAKGAAVLHPTYTYGDRNPGSHPSPSYPNKYGRLNKYSGGGFFVNEQPTLGYALYKAEMFPGLAARGEPMLGRLHRYKFDQLVAPTELIDIYKNNYNTRVRNKLLEELDIVTKQPRYFRTTVMLMEIPSQAAVDYDGELKLDRTGVLNIASISGRITGEKVTIAKGFDIGDTSITADDVDYSEIKAGRDTIKKSDMEGDQEVKLNGKNFRLKYKKKQHTRIQESKAIAKSFLVNPVDYYNSNLLGATNLKPDFYSWPKSRDPYVFSTKPHQTSTGGGPTLDQYVSGITQCDLHIRVSTSGVSVIKVKEDGSGYQLGFISANPAYFNKAITDDGTNLYVNIKELRTLIGTKFGYLLQNGKTKGWPIRGLGIYNDPDQHRTGASRKVVLRGMEDMTDFYYGLSIISEFDIAIDGELNTVSDNSQTHGILADYVGDSTLPVEDFYPPVGVYGKTVRFFENDTNLGKIDFTGAIGGNSGDGKVKMKVNGDSVTTGSAVKFTGIKHQVQLPPITPITWQVTYVVEELTTDEAGAEMKADAGDWGDYDDDHNIDPDGRGSGIPGT